MERHKDEKTLRRLVAGLAQAHPEDVDAVLEELSPDYRRVVRDLLDAYSGRPVPRPATGGVKAAADVFDLRGFSDAIAERLTADDKTQRPNWRMTAAAVNALRGCARQMPPDLALAPVAADRRRWPRLPVFRR